MHWKLKSLIQNVVARLPSSVSHAAYYRMQRSFGGLSCVNPWQTVRAALEIADAIRQNGGQLSGSTILEIGTGRRIVLPLVMWLLGANRVITVDANRYLKPELVNQDLAYFRAHRTELKAALAGHDVDPSRLERLFDASFESRSLGSLLAECRIEYLAPVDAARLPIADGTVDFHVSTNVFEHVPPPALQGILAEAGCIVAPSGLLVHRIDHSDHFSHSDPSLSRINFLRYDERQWSRLAGNRYMYMNRLRVDDFARLFRESGQDVLALCGEPEPEVLEELRDRPPRLTTQFAAKPIETLATLNSLFVSRPSASRPVTQTANGARHCRGSL